MKIKFLNFCLGVLSILTLSIMLQADPVQASSSPVDGEPYNEFWENYQWDALNTWIRKEDGRWWYRNADGSYTKNGWQSIAGKWYYFDNAGWMKKGWVQDNHAWYYLNDSGEMATGWVSNNSNWYYLYDTGAMANNTWIQDGAVWYYVKGSGAMAVKQWISNYYVAENGVWIPDISVSEGCWNYVNGWKYQFRSGNYAVGWIQLEDGWYYLDGDGYMAWDSWIGNYYVGTNGRMLTNSWISEFSTVPFNKKYYVGNDGGWEQGKVYHGADGIWKNDSNGWWFDRADETYPAGEFECVNDNWYFFDSSGYMVTGLMEDLENGGYYYFYENGSMARNATIDGLYFNELGFAE